jgi:long-chain acyl-CoA synthetase
MGCGQTSGLDHIYSKELLFDKDKSTQNSSQTYVNSKVTDYDEVEKNYYKQTYLEKLMNNFTTYKDNNCLGYRKIVSPGQWEDKFTFLKYGEVKIFSQNFIHNLKLLNLVEPFDFGPDEGFHKFFGIYSKNSVEWLVSDFACQMDSITVVTLYNTLGDAAFEHIFKQTLLQTICISPENIKNLLKFKEKFGINTLKNVILFDLTNTLTSEEIDTLQKNNLKVFKFTDLIKPVSTGDKTEIILTPPNPETISTICYTSGTTNLPKGAKISQRAISSQMSILQDSGVNLSSSDIHLSYLPLAHIMERVGTSLVLYVGGSIGFISGDVRKTLTEDCKSLHPTFFFAVPKVLANFRDTIMQKMSQVTGCKRYMIDRALRVKKENYDENNSINHCIYDSSVFSKIHAEFGGKWRFIITGSAPLPIDLGVEIKIIFGCPIVEGYGMTEVAGASHCTHFTDNVNGYVGGPITPSKIKLFDVPELN